MPEPHLGAVLRLAVQFASAQHADDRPDSELLRNYLAAGDPDSFAVLVRRHGPLVWRVCRQVFGHHHDAEDAFQATFLLLARKAGTVRARTHLAGFLHGVAYRVAMTARRAAARRRAREGHAASRDQHGPDWEAAWREVQTLLHEEIDRLPAKYREPFLLCCVEGMGRSEAARQLKLKEGTVWSRLAEARGRLRSRLARRGIDLPAVLGATALTAVAGQAAPAGIEKVTIDAVLGGAAVRSAGAVELARKVSTTMLVIRMKLAAALLVLAGVLATGVGLVARPGVREDQPKQESTAAGPAAPAERPKTGLDRHGDALPAGALLRIGTLRYRTGSSTTQAILSPDGKTLAAASEPGIDLIDLASGKRLTLRDANVPSTFGSTSSFLAFTAGGKELVNVSEGRNIRFWDVATGKLLRQFGKNPEPRAGPGGAMPAPMVRAGGLHWSGVWDAPGSRLLVVSQHGRVEYLAPSSGKVERGFPLRGELASVAPDGKRLASLDLERSEAILHDEFGKEQRRFAHPGRIHRATLTDQGKLLVTVNVASEIRVWDPDTGKERLALSKVEVTKELRTPFVTVTAVSRDGKTLLAGTKMGDVLRWDLSTGKPLKPLRPHQLSWVTGLFCQADGRTLVSVAWDSVVRRTDLATGKTASSGHGFVGYTNVARSPVGSTAAVGDSRGPLELWDTAAGKRLRRLRSSGPLVSGLCFSGDGKLLAVGQGDGAVVLWEPATGKERRRWQAATARPDDEFRIWFAGMCFSADGKLLAASVRPAGTGVWEVATGKEVWHDGATGKVAFSPDGRTLVTGDFDKQLRSRDAATGKVRTTLFFERSNEWIDAIFFSPDGRTLATCHHGGTIYLRDPQTGAVRKRLHGFTEVAWDGSFSPDGKWLAIAGDRAICVWEVATGTELLCFRGHEGRAIRAEFGPDGRTVLSSSFDLTALLWDLRPTPGKKRKPDELWAKLAGDPVSAYQALWALVDDPKTCCALLRRRMGPVKEPADAARVRRLVAQLDSEEFRQREAASRELAAMGELIEATLRSALTKADSAEARRRLKDLLGRLQGGQTADNLRQLRTVHALELCGTAEARQLLRTLAGGASGARLTRDARTALERLEKK
jgi:RNA polymerase sigma factor (sigma-70 family)